MTRIRTVLFVLALVHVHSHAHAQDLVSPARELYAAANYEEALGVLDTIEADARTSADKQTVLEYRVLCLIALDRIEDAAKVIRQIIKADPLYRPVATQRPPRLLALFEHVRRQHLPEVARQRYQDAAVAFDEHRDADASAGFALVLRLVEEAEASWSGERAEGLAWQDLGNLKRFSTQFLDLIRARAEHAQAVKQKPRDTFDLTDADVTPPATIQQEIPLWQAPAQGAPFQGELEILIDTAGNVTGAKLTMPIHPAYDPLLLESARKWKYRPATRDGRPVAYRKIITITLTSDLTSDLTSPDPAPDK